MMPFIFVWTFPLNPDFSSKDIRPLVLTFQCVFQNWGYTRTDVLDSFPMSSIKGSRILATDEIKDCRCAEDTSPTVWHQPPHTSPAWCMQSKTCDYAFSTARGSLRCSHYSRKMLMTSHFTHKPWARERLWWVVSNSQWYCLRFGHACT